MEIAKFLMERLAEDEATARAAAPGPWDSSGPVLAGVVGKATFDTVAVCNSSDWEGGEYSYPATATEAASSVHIARHDPARVLAEVACKRAILAAHEPSTEEESNLSGSKRYEVTRCSVCAEGVGNLDSTHDDYPCTTVRALAAVYAGHPDYSPAWFDPQPRPELPPMAVTVWP